MPGHFDIRVYGRVQGVNFRSGAKQQAEKLGLAGFVKNQARHSVYIEAEGEEENLRKFIEWCKTGTESSKVERVEVTEAPPQNFKGFAIA